MWKKSPQVFLYGNYRNNAGPDNVNRYLIHNCKNPIIYERSNNKLIKRIERLLYFTCSDIIVFSGFGKHKFWLKYAKILGKKTIYLMHGCTNYEAEINQLNIDLSLLEFEKEFLEKVDLVLPVSEYYKEWVCQIFPEIKGKIHFLNSGVVFLEKEQIVRTQESGYVRIVVAGGDRIQKNNIEVARAVEMLSISHKEKIELRICGRKYLAENIFEKYPHSVYLGMLEQKEFYNELKRANIFIMNSEVESFGLSAIDALCCGCNVLISQYSGIRSLLNTKGNDIIYNVHNPKEIADKIEALLKDGNNSRLLLSIDAERYSWINVAERLYNICCAVYKGEDYGSIR